ncbi:MAG TPA: hypothetical protein VGB08_05735 [Allosphingosinicella sp.]
MQTIREAIMDEKKPNAGTGTSDNPQSWGASGDVDRREPEAADKMNGRSGGGDSGGGAYPNPHTGKEGKRGGFMDHGGQTEMPYHGSGRLGEDVVGDNENAPAAKTKPGEGRDYENKDG